MKKDNRKTDGHTNRFNTDVDEGRQPTDMQTDLTLTCRDVDEGRGRHADEGSNKEMRQRYVNDR